MISQKPEISLFFIISPKYNIAAIESFLRKRNYVVNTESDIKAGLMKLIEVQPDFVFIALDHPNPKISVLPQVIEQCLTTNVIPFLHGSAKDEIKKLDDCTLIHKIFPPMSGPAIERMTLKLGPQLTEVEKKKQRDQNMDLVLNGYLAQLNDQQGFKVDGASASKEHASRLKSKNSFYADSGKKQINPKQKLNLQADFERRIQPYLKDILETFQSSPSIDKQSKTIYCLLIQSEAWSGHLMAYSNVTLDSHLLEPVFKNWVTQEFRYLGPHDSHVFFEIEINLRDFKVWAENKSEYFQSLKVNDAELMMSFIGIEPSELLMEFDEEQDLIEVDLDLITLNTDLGMKLFLHLPENKKYLLYTPLHQQMSRAQKQRLQENKVEKLYTPVEYENEVQKLKMKKYLTTVFDTFRNEEFE